MIEDKSNKITDITLDDGDTEFGIVRKAGTIIYNKAAKKAYILQEDVLAIQTLDEITAKIEL